MDNEILEPIGKGLYRSWKLDKIIHEERTPFQNVLIAETSHGKTLFCGVDRQSSERTQLIYHEAMIWPALLHSYRPVRNALVIGSSEGVVTQILRDHCHDGGVYHVDIDRACVEACALYLPYGYTQEDVRELSSSGHLIFADGYGFLRSNGGLWDLICMDLPDEVADETVSQNQLYGVDFLRVIKSRMTNHGVFITQAGCPTDWRNETLKRMWTRMKSVFPYVRYWDCPEHEWAWMMGFIKQPPQWSLPADKEKWPKTIHPKAIEKSLSPPSCLLFHESID